MSTVRRGPLPADNFTIISNEWTRDAALSWEARGFLAWLAGHSEAHQITEADMIAAGSFKRDGVRRMIRELEQRGYLRRKRTYKISGGSTVDYLLTDLRPPSEPSSPADGSGGGRAEQGELFSVEKEPAGHAQDLPADGSGGGRSYTEDQKKNTKTSSSGTAKRGTRVPDDFEPTEAMKTWFAEKGYPRLFHGATEHEKFMDFWRAKPGSGGVKLDWPATWRNWMREAADRAQRVGYNRPVSAPPGASVVPYSGGTTAGYRPSTTDQKIAQTLELGRRLQRQMEEAQ